MSYLYKPKNSRNWAITFYIGGKAYSRSLGVSNKRDAQALQRRVDMLLAEGRLDPDTMLRSVQQGPKVLSALIEDYCRWVESRTDMKVGSRARAAQAARRLLKFVGNLQLSEITDDLVEFGLLPAMRERYSVPYIQHNISNWRTMFNYAKKRQFVRHNPFSAHMPKSPPRNPVFYTKEQLAKILEYLKAPERPQWQRCYFILLLNTGLRMSEGLNLTWSELHLNEPHPFMTIKGKGDRERRVPLNDVAVRELLAMPRRIGNDRVFYMVKNDYAVKSAQRRARKQLPFLKRIHDYRSNYASWFIMNGGSREALKEIMGWSTYAMVERYKGLAPEFIHQYSQTVRIDN